MVVPGTSSTSPISAPDIYIYIYIEVYLGNKLLFKQVLLKTMKHYLFFVLILFFQDSLLFF